jgi:3'-phosphoadenosine 5'-phosphosulfate sulfotransferase
MPTKYLWLVKKLYLYMKFVRPVLDAHVLTIRNVFKKSFSAVAVTDSSVQKTVRVTRVVEFIQSILTAVDVRVNCNNDRIHNALSRIMNKPQKPSCRRLI